MRRSPLVLSPLVAILLLAGSARAADLRITLPKRTKPTPVQKLNQDGVRAIQKHRYEEARKLFYRAYLLDPDDPFTLNNLGYISELSGDLDRAQRFYELAAQNTSDATVDRASSDEAAGKSIAQVAGKADDKKIQVNRYNVQAIGLLNKDRAPEADLVLQKALALDPTNPFTLNNLGYAKEKEGELEQALSFYSRAANANSDEPIVVTMNRNWRGQPISEIAGENVRNLRKLMSKSESVEARVQRLNLQGVSAMNRNDHAAARRYFEQAYKLDNRDAFTLNNMGFLAELDGDRETADFYYAKAADAQRRNAKVTVATRREVEGKAVGQVALLGDEKIAARMEEEREVRAREGGPVVLRRRDNSAIAEPEAPVAPAPRTLPGAAPNEVRIPVPEQPVRSQPEPSQPTATGAQPVEQPRGEQPRGEQPAQPQPSQPADILPPLPEPNAQPRKHPDPSLGPLPGSTEAPSTQPQRQPGDVLPPLPDNQQPPQTPRTPPPQS